MSKALLIVLLIALGGCADFNIPAVTNLATVPDGEALVFGQLRVIVNGKEVRDEIVFEDDNFNRDIYAGFVVWIVPETGATYAPHWLTRKNKGEFYWHLPPGNYDIAAFGYVQRSPTNNQMTRLMRPMHIRFTIPTHGKLVYIGSLVVTFKDKDSLSGRSYDLNIEDTYKNAFVALQRNFPEATSDAAKYLMRIENTR